MQTVNSPRVNETCCPLCQYEIFNDEFNKNVSRTAGNVVVVACCKGLIHRDCWQGWEKQDNGSIRSSRSNLAIRKCIICQNNALPVVHLSTIAYQNSETTDYLKEDDAKYLKVLLRQGETHNTAPGMSPPSASNVSAGNTTHSLNGVPSLDHLVRNELSKYKEPDVHSASFQSSVESFPLQACHIGDTKLISQILHTKPELAHQSLYSVSYGRKLPMTFVAADNWHIECVKKLAAVSHSSFTQSLSIGIRDQNEEALRILVYANSARVQNELNEAVKRRDHHTVSVLISSGVNCEKTLRDAINNHNHETIESLIHCGINPVDIFIMAARENKIELLKQLAHKKYIDPITGVNAEIVATCQSAQNNETVALHALIASGTDLNSALLFSTRQRNPDVVQALLKAGAKPYIALSLAAKIGTDAFIKASNVLADDHNGHLRMAAELGNERLVKCLLDAGADINGGYNQGNPLTPLLIAAGNGHTRVVNTLFAYHHSEDNPRINAICQAALSSDDETLSTLLNSYQNEGEKIKDISHIVLNAVNEDGKQVLKRLVQMGEAGKSGAVLLNAAISGNQEILENLLAAGADANTSNSNGWSLLHIVASKANREAAQLLIDKGALIDKRSANGETALAIAASRGHKTIVDMLIKAAGGGNIYSEIEASAERGDHEMLDQLLGIADIDGNQFRQLLQLVAGKNNTDALQKMRNQNPVSAEIAFTEAFDNNELSMVAEFLKAGIGRNCDSHTSLLLMAAVKKDRQKVNIMIQNGVEVTSDIYKAAEARELDALSVMLTAFTDIEAKNTLIQELVNKAAANRNHAVFSALVSIDKQFGTVGIGNILSSAMTQRKKALIEIRAAQTEQRQALTWIDENPMDDEMDDEMEEQYHLHQALAQSTDDEIRNKRTRAEISGVVINSFIRAGVHFNLADDTRRSLLRLAIDSGCHDTVKAILDSWSQADEASNSKGETSQQTLHGSHDTRKNLLTEALLLAIDQKQWDMVKSFLQNAADTIGIDSNRLNECNDLLYKVAEAGNNQLIKKLWRLGVHATPSLNKALSESNVELLNRFAESGIKINAADVGDQLHPLTTVMYMYGDREPGMIRLLSSLTENLDEFIFGLALMDQPDKVALFWRCAGSEYKQVLNILTYAVHTGNIQVFKTLKGIDDIAATFEQCLCDASLQGNQKVVELLLENGIDINEMNMNPAWLLYKVAIKDQKIASMLLSAWKGKANRNCLVLITQAWELTKEQCFGEQCFGDHHEARTFLEACRLNFQ